MAAEKQREGNIWFYQEKENSDQESKQGDKVNPAPSAEVMAEFKTMVSEVKGKLGYTCDSLKKLLKSARV